MQKSLYQFAVWIISLVVLIIVSAQSTHELNKKDQQPPAEIWGQLDSLRKADNLTEWLYTYRAYVYEDPVNRIPILTNAQANAWRSCKTDAERAEWFNCLAAQGYYLLYSGNILRSIDAYEKAYRFYFDKPIPGTDVLEYVLKPLGNNYTRLGDYDRAFLIQEKSLALAQEQDSIQVASICHNLATTSIWKEDLALAKQYCQKGMKYIKPKTALHGLLLSTLSEVLLRSGKTDSAEISCRTAIRILTARLAGKKEDNVAYWLRGAWQGLGDIQKEKQQPAAALVSYQKARLLIETHFAGQRKREHAKLSVSTGRMLLALQQPGKAIAQFNDAVTLMVPSFQPAAVDELPGASSLYGENSLLDALHGKADCLNALGRKEQALVCYMLLYQIEKKLRREFFSITAKQQQQKESRQWAESAIETAFDLWKTTGHQDYANTILLIAEMSKAQLLLDEIMNNLHFNRIKNKDTLLDKEWQMVQAINLYEKEAVTIGADGKQDSNALAAKKELQYELSLLQKQVKEKHPYQDKLLTGGELPSIDSLLQYIEPNTAVIEFFTGSRNIYSIKVENNKVAAIQKINNADSILSGIKDLTEKYFQSGPANMLNDPQQYYKAAYGVYHKLLNRTELNKPNCIIIPDGILGYLPFDALVTDPVYKPAIDQWPFLVKKTNLYFSYSLQTRQQQLNQENTSSTFAGFFISFDSSNAAIPAVKKEYAEIHAVMKGKYFKEAQASLAAFNEQLGEADLLHISTHSFLQGKENMPVLQLADDPFFLFELYGKSFNPKLVVLSACRTGHGMLAKGEGIISLARGFTAGGAAGIVAGLWDMNDETTAGLMGSFYNFLRNGESPAGALHHAKLKWLQDKNDQQFLKLPYYWAGMVYSGNNKPVLLTPVKGYSTYWWLAVVVAVAALIFFIKKKRMVLK